MRPAQCDQTWPETLNQENTRTKMNLDSTVDFPELSCTRYEEREPVVQTVQLHLARRSMALGHRRWISAISGQAAYPQSTAIL